MDWQEIWNRISNFFVTGGLSILKAFLVLAIGYVVIALIRRVVKKMLDKSKIEKLGRQFVYKAVTIVLWVALALILFDIMAIPITGFIAAISAIGIAIALALQDTLASLANGVILLFTKPFKQNDVIKVDGETCVVYESRLLSTVVDTFDNRRLIIPNKDIVSKKLENLTANPIRRVEIEFSVSYDTDIKKLRQVVFDTMLANPDVLTDPKPEFFCTELGDYGVKFKARCWALSVSCDLTKNQVLEQIFNELKRNSISMPFPQLEVRQLTNKVVLPFDDTELKVDPEAKRVAKKFITENDDMLNLSDFSKKRAEFYKKRDEAKQKRAQKRAEKIALKEKKKAQKIEAEQKKQNKQAVEEPTIETETPTESV